MAVDLDNNFEIFWTNNLGFDATKRNFMDMKRYIILITLLIGSSKTLISGVKRHPKYV